MLWPAISCRRRELLDLLLKTKQAAPSIHSITNLRSFGSSPDIESKSFVQNDGRYVLSLDGQKVQRKLKDGGPAGPALAPLLSVLRHQAAATFLPAGYPATVSPGYFQYVGWQAVHHCCSAANGVLASSFMLYSVGLGAGAVATAGALNWVLKDGLGQLGTLLFGRAIAHNFDVASRRWYLTASVKLNLAMGLEIATFMAPQHFVALGSLANALKGIAWMAGGSSRSAFNVAFAADSNIGDVTAKATSQTICTSLIGTAAGMALASQVGQSAPAALTCYACIAGIHLWSGYRSVRRVPLATLNPSRLGLLTEAFVGNGRSGLKSMSSPLEPGAMAVKPLPSPSELAAVDPILPTRRDSFLRVGSPLSEMSAAELSALKAAVQGVYSDERHVLVPSSSGSSSSSSSSNEYHLILREDAGAEDCILAVLQFTLLNHGKGKESEDEGGTMSEVQALEAARAVLPALLRELKEAGWDTGRAVLEAQRRRATW